MLRVIALYQQNRTLAFLLYGLFATTHIVAISLVVHITVLIWRQYIYLSTQPFLILNAVVPETDDAHQIHFSTPRYLMFACQTTVFETFPWSTSHW